MNLNRLTTKKKVKMRVKKYDFSEMREYIEKNIKPRPRLDIVKWMEKHGR